MENTNVAFFVSAYVWVYLTFDSLPSAICIVGSTILAGLEMTAEYLNAKKIPYKRNGKLVIAVTEDEVARLKKLMVNAQSSGVEDLAYIDSAEGIRYESRRRIARFLWQWQRAMAQLPTDMSCAVFSVCVFFFFCKRFHNCTRGQEN